MPTLPSGIRVWLSMEAILPADRLFYPCPSGRFWYRDLDPLVDDGHESGHTPPERLRLGEVPETRLDAAAFVRVLFATPREVERRWRGDWLLTLERPSDLTEEDWKSLLAFLGTDRALAFLDLARERCRQQAATRGRAGAADDLGDFGPGLHGAPEHARRLAMANGLIERVGARLAEAERENRVEETFACRSRLEQMLAEADRTLDRFGPHRALAHRAIALAASHLGDRGEATRHARAYDEIVPDEALEIEIDRRLVGVPVWTD